MLFCSGRTYSPDHLDMDTKLDLILKKFQDLKVRVDGLKSKSERTLENRNDRRRDESTSRPRINEDDIIHMIKTVSHTSM